MRDLTPEALIAIVEGEATEPFYPAVTSVVEHDSRWLVCANGHRWVSINPSAGCPTCADFHKYRVMGRPECTEEGCTIPVMCSQRAWDAGVRKCRLHWQMDRSREWNVAPVGIDEWIAGMAEFSNNRWNGWAMPWFDAHTTAKIIEWVTRDESSADHYEFEWDGLTLVHTEIDGDDRYVERLEPNEDGLYSIGAGSWVWSDDEWDDDLTRWLNQNELARHTVTPEQICELNQAEFAEHHAGGLYVLLKGLDGDGRLAKCHDSWGDSTTVVLHVYDPDAEGDDGDAGVTYFDTGREAVAHFLSL